MRAIEAVLVLLALAMPALAQEEPGRPDTPAQAVDKVLAAFLAEEHEALRALAAKDDPDPWLVADELCLRGERDVAEAFAKAAPRPDTENLPEYVRSIREPEDGSPVREILAALTRARELAGKGDFREESRALAEVARRAEKIGWLSRVADAWHESGAALCIHGEYRGAGEAWRERLATEEKRKDLRGVAISLSNLGLIARCQGAGDIAQGVVLLNRSLAVFAELDDRAGVALVRGHLGAHYRLLGAYPQALDHLERSLGLPTEEARIPGALVNLASQYFDLGDRPEALRARGMKVVGEIHLDLGDLVKALDHLVPARDLMEEMKCPDGAARTLLSLARVQAELGERDPAVASCDRAKYWYELWGSLRGVADALERKGIILVGFGEHRDAVAPLKRALEIAERLADRVGTARVLTVLAGAEEALGEGEEAVAHRKRAVDLADEVTRLLVSPDGPLHEVPFSLLVGDREVANVPSGTTYIALQEVNGEGGEGVLALGDPQVSKCGGRLLPLLPASREEAKAVGDVVLLGAEATERKLAETLATRERWRAVHIAGHSLVDTGRPMSSALLLAPDPESDGHLTCLEISRLTVPADLVVLSASETARGKVYVGEGTVGLTRAFMMAGATRVIGALWKVDDEATKALMVKFYELWNPEKGKGLPAATALKQAQEFVRSHEKWNHPYYWAAWVLWGLPE